MSIFEAQGMAAFMNHQRAAGAHLKEGEAHDPVNHPSHYISDTGLEAVEVIEAFASDNPHRSHALKYLLRAGRKGGMMQRQEDLQKALWWINRELDKAERELAALEKGEAS